MLFDHPKEAGSRDDRKEEAAIQSPDARAALLAAAVAGFTRLYSEKHGELVPPDDVKQQTAKVRNDLNPYSAYLDPDDSKNAVLEVTGDRRDGVIASEAWEEVRREHERASGPIRGKVSREKVLFESALEQRGAVLTKSGTRFKNCAYWRGVRWSERVKEAGWGVTWPNWKQTDDEGEDEN